MALFAVPASRRRYENKNRTKTKNKGIFMVLIWVNFMLIPFL
jgi:hypothetical protein